MQLVLRGCRESMMNNLCLRFFFKVITVSLLMLIIIARFKAHKCRTKHLKIVSPEGPSLPPEEIISSHNVEHPVKVNCNFLCFDVSECVGFNFRANTNAINCQLTNTTKNKNHAEGGKWTLYQDDEENQKNAEAPTGGLYESEILNQQQDYIAQLEEWLDGAKPWKLCYRATDDGWLASTFHHLCDFKKPTITIIRSGSYIFGAYTDAAFGSSSGEYKTSFKDSFIFSFVNKDNLPPFKSPVKDLQSAIYTDPNYGPTFGGGPDIMIVDKANKNKYSYTDFGQSYQTPTGYSYGSTKAMELLAGTYNFTPDEVETFYFN